MTEHDLLKPQEVADRLRVSYSTIIRWIYEGKLPACKVGIQWRVARKDADAMLEPEKSRPTEA